jgi:hypothetical protein
MHTFAQDQFLPSSQRQQTDVDQEEFDSKDAKDMFDENKVCLMTPLDLLINPGILPMSLTKNDFKMPPAHR